MALTLPPGYVARPPTLDDVEEILALTIACDIADIGEPNCDIDDVRGDLQDEALDLEQDAALVFAESGALATYAVVSETIAFVYVHPDHVDRGLGSALVPFVDERTRAHGADVVRQQVVGTNDRARALLSTHGYSAAQRYWQMRMGLDVEPAAAVWPQEVTVRTFALPGDERDAYELVQLTFSEIPGHVVDRFERWRANATARAQFAPDLSWVAEIEGRTIGVATLRVLGGRGPPRLALRRAGSAEPRPGSGPTAQHVLGLSGRRHALGGAERERGQSQRHAALRGRRACTSPGWRSAGRSRSRRTQAAERRSAASSRSSRATSLRSAALARRSREISLTEPCRAFRSSIRRSTMSARCPPSGRGSPSAGVGSTVADIAR